MSADPSLWPVLFYITGLIAVACGLYGALRMWHEGNVHGKEYGRFPTSDTFE